MNNQDIVRCWGRPDDPLMMRYHDEEWGVPLHDDRGLFEFLVLDGFQAGLSWRTILHKREAFRRAFDGFDTGRIARYTDEDQQRLLNDSGIVRNRLKIAATITNAQRFLEVQREFGITPNFELAEVYLEENDGAGNTFKATAKPVLIGTAVVGATTLIFSIIQLLNA